VLVVVTCNKLCLCNFYRIAEVSRRLLLAGANPMVSDKDGCTALHIAAAAFFPSRQPQVQILLGGGKSLADTLLNPASPESVFLLALCSSYGQSVGPETDAVWTAKTAVTAARNCFGLSVFDVLCSGDLRVSKARYSAMSNRSWGVLQLVLNSDAIDACLAFSSSYLKPYSDMTELLAIVKSWELRRAALCQGFSTSAEHSEPSVLIVPEHSLPRNHGALWKLCGLHIQMPLVARALPLVFISYKSDLVSPSLQL
jgi:hypothetical protein